MSLQEAEIEIDDDWTERFIDAIKCKPAIYDKSLKEHSDRNIINRLWAEVYEAVVDSWNDMTPQDKNVKGREIQQRWRNLRTCFRRELNKQRKEKSGQAVSKRQKYVYFDQLLFLLPTVEDRETVSETSPPHTEQEVSDNEVEEANTTPSTQPQRTPAKKQKKISYEESLLNILKESRTEEIDEDKSFLLSLVPSFKKLTDDEKIEVKMEFLSIIRRFTQPTLGSSAAATPANLLFQGPQNYNPNLQQSVGYRFPQNASLHMLPNRNPQLKNAVMSPRSSTSISSDNSQNSWMSSNNPKSPEAEFFELT